MRLTTLLVLVIIPSAIATVAAQESGSTRPATLVGGTTSYSGYFGFDTRVTRVNGVTGVFAGGEAVLLLDHRFAIGVGGFGLASHNARIGTGATARRLSMGYGGFTVGYVAQSSSMIHPTLGVTIGGGSVNAGEDPDGTGSDGIFVLEPALGLELSVAPALRLGAGLTYRYVSDVDLAGLRNPDLRAMSGQIVIRLGKF